MLTYRSAQAINADGSPANRPTTISLAPDMTALFVDGQSNQIGTTAPSSPWLTTKAPVLTIGSQVYTAVSGSKFIVDGQTLTPGGVITVIPKSGNQTAVSTTKSAGFTASSGSTIRNSGTSNRQGGRLVSVLGAITALFKVIRPL